MNDFYEELACFYDALNGGAAPASLAAFTKKAIERFSDIKAEIVLDLACGTGSVSLELDRLGYDVIAADGSAGMLAKAREKAEAAGRQNDILFLCQDMRSFELYGSVQAIVCYTDSLNHLTGSGDLTKCFALAANYLERGGLFIFDVNTPYKFENYYADNSFILEDKGVYLGWQNAYNRKSGTVDFYITLFARQRGKTVYTRKDLCLRERRYSMKTLISALKKTGFCLCGVYADTDFGEIKDDTGRWFFIAKKL